MPPPSLPPPPLKVNPDVRSESNNESARFQLGNSLLDATTWIGPPLKGDDTSR